MIEITDLDTGRKLSVNPSYIVFVETRKLTKITQKKFWFFRWYKNEIDVIEEHCVVWTNAVVWNYVYKAALSVAHRVVESQEEVIKMIEEAAK